MSLGPNDCLGIPSRSVGPDRLAIGGMAGQGSISTYIGRWLTIVEDKRKGSFEYISNPVYGDTFVIKKEGRYSVRFHAVSGSGGGWCALVKNLPLAMQALTPGTNFANLPHSNKQFLLDLASGNFATGITYGHKPGGEFWFVPGDVISMNVDNTYNSDACHISFEYLGGQ